MKFLVKYPPFIWLKKHKINKIHKKEINYIKKKELNAGSEQSIVFFTVYKAASSFIGKILKDLISDTNLQWIDFDSYFFDIGKGKAWEGEGRNIIDISYKSKGFVFGPFRSFNKEIKNLENFKILLVVRDPRDVIVSGYFSLYSHAFPRTASAKKIKEIKARRAKRLHKDIDAYVLEKAEVDTSTIKRYYDYADLLGKKNVLFLKYEDMVFDFNNWLDKIVSFFNIDINEEIINKIKQEANFDVSKEDKFKHKRQVIPGDYKRKLKEETIKELNKRLKEILTIYNYTV